MKKIVLILGAVFFMSNIVYADEDKQATDEIKIQVEVHKKECYNKYYPVDNPEKMNYIFSYYNDSIKKYLPKYNSCLKNIIIENIKKISSEKDIVKFTEALDKIEQGVLDFYRILSTQTDTGIVGKAWNDNELGRRYEGILYDVLWYQSIYGNNL